MYINKVTYGQLIIKYFDYNGRTCGRKRSLARLYKVDWRWSESNLINGVGRGEVIHLIVEYYASVCDDL